MTDSFRNRFILSGLIASPDNISRCVISSDSDTEPVEILGPQGDGPISNAMELRLRGMGYSTREATIEAGKLWRDRLTVAFAHFDRGIEIGSDETPDVPHYSYGRPYFILNQGQRMRDTPKLVVFATNDEPQWGGLSADAVVAYGIKRFVDGPLAWVKQRNCELNDSQQLAYKFVHGSFFEANPESTYILLFTGVETLVPNGFRADELVDTLTALQSNLASISEVSEATKNDVHKLLEYDKNEAIRYRGRNWVKLLGEERFDDKTPEQYLLDAYATRSTLAHGNVRRPPAESLNDEIPELRRFLLALLDMTVFGELMPLGW